jgi:hypothetical protein
VMLGFGFVLGGSFEDIVYLKTPTGLQRLSPKTSWRGFGVEAYLQRTIRGHLWARVGATLDAGADTAVFHPVALAVVMF